MKTRFAFVAALLLVIAVPAQGGTLYMTSTILGDSGEGPLSCPVEQAWDTSLAPPAEDGKAYVGFSAVAISCGFSFWYTAEEAFTLSGPGELKAYVSCDAAGLMIEFDYYLSVAGEQVSSNRPAVTFPCTPGDVYEHIDAVALEDPVSVAAGDLISLRLVAFTGPTGAGDDTAGNFHVMTGAAFPSGLTLSGIPAPSTSGPAAPTGPTVVYEDLDDTGFTHSFQSPQNNTFVLNATVEGDAPRAIYSASVGGGSADLTVTDNAGVEVFTMRFDADAEETTQDLTGAEPGEWTYRVEYTGFTGELSFGVTEPAPTTTSPTTSAPPTTTQPPTTSGPQTTTAPTTAAGEGNDSPGVGLLALLALVGVALVAARRRL